MYTHYFAYDPNAESFAHAWPQMVDDARTIAEHVQNELGVVIAGGDGTGEPEFSERWIRLNGTARGHLAHETLLIDMQPWRTWDENAELGYHDWARMEWTGFREQGFAWAFCKTVRNPYDIAVTSILLRCTHLALDAFVIGSDGDWEHEWQHGAAYWGAGCKTGPAPVEIVRRLFAQTETPGRSRLSNTGRGPRSAREGRERETSST